MANKDSLSSSPVLQPEIWSHIFAFLRRQPPPPFQTKVEWEDLHQEDLTAVSRVSSVRSLPLAIP